MTISIGTAVCLAVIAVTRVALRSLERRTRRNLDLLVVEYETKIRRSREDAEAAIRRTTEGRR